MGFFVTLDNYAEVDLYTNAMLNGWKHPVVLRILPKRFNMKVTTTEEAKDLSNIKIDELIGSI